MGRTWKSGLFLGMWISLSVVCRRMFTNSGQGGRCPSPRCLRNRHSPALRHVCGRADQQAPLVRGTHEESGPDLDDARHEQRGRKGGEQPFKSSGACASQYSVNSSPSVTLLSRVHWPSTAWKTSTPSHMSWMSCAGKTYQPNEEAARMASQYWKAAVGMVPSAALSPSAVAMLPGDAVKGHDLVGSRLHRQHYAHRSRSAVGDDARRCNAATHLDLDVVFDDTRRGGTSPPPIWTFASCLMMEGGACPAPVCTLVSCLLVRGGAVPAPTCALVSCLTTSGGANPPPSSTFDPCLTTLGGKTPEPICTLASCLMMRVASGAAHLHLGSVPDDAGRRLAAAHFDLEILRLAGFHQSISCW